MAKVGVIKFEFQGDKRQVNVNCTSGGIFNCHLPDEVAKALLVDKTINSDTLANLEKTFFDLLKKYKETTVKEELFILIAYYARGNYSKYADGSYMFGGHGHKYNLEVNFSRPYNALGLDFFVAIKQTVDGKEEWFKATLGKDFPHWETEKNAQPDTYFKNGKAYIKEYKAIPFDQEALNSLNIANEKMRAISEMLFHFIEQPEEQILLTLNKQKFLN